uniref:Uncharacterized protein n=1 Tax=Arundo donax TaxID=35708 RepID=A0A0A8YYF8_ARUDO
MVSRATKPLPLSYSHGSHRQAQQHLRRSKNTRDW